MEIRLFCINDVSNLIQDLVDFESDDLQISLTGSAIWETDIIQQLKLQHVDIVIFNLVAPELLGVGHCKQLKEEFPKLKIIVATEETNTDILRKIWLQKVDALVPKTVNKNEMNNVIRSVMKGHRIINHNIPRFTHNSQSNSVDIPHLTKTEIELLTLLGAGLLRKEAAHKMNISLSTVQFHSKNIFEKFNDHKMQSILEKVRKARIIK